MNAAIEINLLDVECAAEALHEQVVQRNAVAAEEHQPIIAGPLPSASAGSNAQRRCKSVIGRPIVSGWHQAAAWIEARRDASCVVNASMPIYGVYFVEDMHAGYWHVLRDSKKSFLDVCKELLEHMHAHCRGAPPMDFLIDRFSARPTASIGVAQGATMIQEMQFLDLIVAIYKTRRAYVPYFLCTPW